MQFLPSLNGLRAVSIGLVLIEHLNYSSSLHPALRYFSMAFSGGLGVRIFFVISGFLITYLLMMEKVANRASLTKFYARRILRIFPAYYAFVLALFVLTLTTDLTLSNCDFITALTFTKNYGCSQWIDGHLWSLAVEEQFYLIWPVILLFGGRRTIVVALALAVLIAPISRVIGYFYGTPYWLTSNMDALAWGAITAILMTTRPAWLRGLVSWRPTLGMIVTIGCLAVPEILASQNILGRLVVPFGLSLQSVAGAYLVASVTLRECGLVFRVLNLSAISYLGVLSYSIYIWQQPFFASPSVLGFLGQFPLNLIGCIIVAMASYHLFEKPFIGLRRRLA